MVKRNYLATIGLAAALAAPMPILAWQNDNNNQANNQSNNQGDRDRTGTTSNMDQMGSRDEQLTNRVQNRLYDSLSLFGSDIQVQARKHTVTLTGKVADENAKQRAERIANRTPGVYDVENKLEVDSQYVTNRRTNVPDDRLSRDVAQAIGRELNAKPDQDWLFGWDVSAGQWEIEVDADGGVVTLSGDAKTYGDANRAVQAAAKVPGVKSVRNNIGLSWETRMNNSNWGNPYYGYYPYWY